MKLVVSIAEMQEFSRRARAAGKSLGFVPTMGALHDGHVSLVRQAKHQCDVVVVSIFVNPTQFGPGEDFGHYPRDIKKDLELLRSFKIDAVFTPRPEEFYPPQFETFVEPGEIADWLEGQSRPGHFRGVATAVLKLFNIVNPHVSYFGQKDFQQAIVVRRMVEDLNLGVRLVIRPIVRDADGLALSSRNAFLSWEDRQAALALSRSLRRAEEMVHSGEIRAARVLEEMRQLLEAETRLELDYVTIVEPAQLRPVETVTAGCVALVAARMGSTRVIDNLILGPPGTSPEMLLQLALTSPTILGTEARIPGLETEALKLRIESCRDCAALSSVRLPPREFMVKYLKRDYPDLNAVRVAVIGRDAPGSPDNFLYQNPRLVNRFETALFELLGVNDFDEFKTRFVLTDALRCHATGPRVPEPALRYCARHLRDELKLFPRLEALVILGEDAYWQFQRLLLNRSPETIKAFNVLLQEAGSAREDLRVPALGDRPLRVYYCFHPTFGYRHSPSIADWLAEDRVSMS